MAGMPERTRVALALGSGGARGYAHIGVIEVLEERGFEIVSIAGSSMGALVGGLHAAGTLAPYTDWVRALRQRDVVRLLDVSLSAPGAIRAEKILARVRELLGGALIEDLPVSFTAVATDLLARKEVWFQKGRVDVAIRASIAIPTVITPVMLNGRLLADGALTNPVPIAPTASAQADLTVAVSVAVVAEDPFGALPAGLGKFDMMNESLDTMQSVLTRYRLAGFPPDVLVSVPRDSCRSLDFHRAAEMIDLGRTLAEEAFDRAGVA